MNAQNDDSLAADRFRSVAERFCALVDSVATLDKIEFLVQIYRMLSELIGEAMRLPRVGFDDTEGEDSDEQTLVEPSNPDSGRRSGQWSQLHHALKEKLGDWNLYRQVFDPTKDSEAIHGSLADDIADIYGDLKDGLDYMESDTGAYRDAIFEWRFAYYSHWGKHAIDALRTIHFLLNDTLS